VPLRVDRQAAIMSAWLAERHVEPKQVSGLG
jgi:hypothetical protein